jgi:hypothetical protein
MPVLRSGVRKGRAQPRNASAAIAAVEDLEKKPNRTPANPRGCRNNNNSPNNNKKANANANNNNDQSEPVVIPTPRNYVRTRAAVAKEEGPVKQNQPKNTVPPAKRNTRAKPLVVTEVAALEQEGAADIGLDAVKQIRQATAQKEKMDDDESAGRSADKAVAGDGEDNTAPLPDKVGFLFLFFISCGLFFCFFSFHVQGRMGNFLFFIMSLNQRNQVNHVCYVLHLFIFLNHKNLPNVFDGFYYIWNLICFAIFGFFFPQMGKIAVLLRYLMCVKRTKKMKCFKCYFWL